MSSNEIFSTTLLSKRILPGALLAALGLGCVVVLRPFMAPILWATILAYATWPMYCRVRARFGRFNTAAALLMTLSVCCAVVLPVLWLLVLVRGELIEAFRQFAAFLAHGPHTVPAVIRDIPWIGERVQEGLDRYAADPATLLRELLEWTRGWAGNLKGLLGDVVRNLGKLLLAVLTLFFFYRDGDLIVAQARRVVRRFFDSRLDVYIAAAGAMTRAVLFGFVITAMAQGLIAGIGYQVVGLQASALLGALTGVLSTVPMLGTALVWAPIGVWLMFAGQAWKGFVLLAWGMLLVHPIDNVLRPLLISNATRVPFLLIMLGALGGLAAFGLVGAFVGPVLLGVAVAIWREWAAEDVAPTSL